jgi:DNA-binding NarL/FixJ family response regulator
MSEPYCAAVRVVLPHHDGTEQVLDRDQPGLVTTIPIIIEVVITLHQEGRVVEDGGEPVQLYLPAALTRREREVLSLVAQHYSNRMIAEQLVLSVDTVKTYVSHILEKLAVSNRYEAAEVARRARVQWQA